MSDSNNQKVLTQWCSDAMHDVFGFADTVLAGYLVSVARRAQSSREIIQVLQEGEVQANHDTLQSFANRLYEKVRPVRRTGTGTTTTTTTPGTRPPPPTTNADWLRAASQYKLVVDEAPLKNTATNDTTQSNTDTTITKGNKTSHTGENDHDRDDGKRRNKTKDSSSVRKRKRSRHQSTNEEESSDESNSGGIEQVRRNAEERRRHRREKDVGDKIHLRESKLTEDERAELERERDLKERDELVQRMLERDQSKTKKLSMDKDDAVDEAEDQKRVLIEERLARGETVYDETTGREITLERLREESRRVYLKKREERELELLKQSLEDEKELFRDTKLTEMERKRIELGKKILSMVDNREGEAEKNDGFYRLPDDIDAKQSKADRDQSLLSKRYVETKHEKTEQELWEESQTQKAGALTSWKKNQVKDAEEEKYELVFEDEKIDFVIMETSKGYDRRKKDVIEKEMDVHFIETKHLSEHEKILEGRQKLPVYPYRDEFLAAVKDHQVLILVGETGSGKTTQIPQYLHEVGYSELGKIGCTQPRRVAAMSVAARVAQEMNVKLGHEVGYSIRFENCTSVKTIIQYMTDGMLLREILTEPDLASYSCMVIDEAHERTLHTDILFGLVKDIVRFRSDLKLIVSSATLDAEKFSKYFDGASIFMIPGRMFPVDIYYTKAPEADYVDAAIVTVLQIHITQPLDGDILVFLTGQEEIETAAEILTQRCRNLGSKIPELMVCPIYANLPSDQQAKIFEQTPKGARKVVLATNIAETSLTINGICYVIDTGFNKQKSFNARAGVESLVVTPISQAAANQRAGRAGRTQPGKCFRLFTAFSFQHELEPNTVPEILRSNMANVVLMLKSLGINDLLNFDFMDRPPADALIRALEQLYALGSLNDRGELTKLGRRMAEFPLDPMLSKAVIASEKYQCTSEVLSTVAMLSLGASVFYRPKEKAVHADTARLNFARGGGGDHIALLRCYRDWAATDYSAAWCFENFVQVRSMKKARDIREQLESLCERVEIDCSVSNADDFDATLKAVTAGFFYNVAKLGKGGEYQTVKHRKTIYIHPSSVLAKEENPAPWLVYFELAFTTKEFMRQVAPIQPGWLIELAPHYYQEQDVEDAKSKKMPKSRH